MPEKTWSSLYLRKKDWLQIEEALDWGSVTPPERIDGDMLLGMFAYRVGSCIRFATTFYALEDHDPEIVFCFLQSAALNAAAFKSRGVYCVGISLGLIDKLLAFCTQLAASEPVLDLFGLPPVEGAGPQDGALLAQLRLAAVDHRVVLTLLFAVLDFVVFHEVTHLVHGHHAVPARSGQFTEGLGSPLSPDEALSSQALEHDADCTGVRNAMVFGELEGGAFATAMAASRTRRIQLSIIGAYIFMKALQIATDEEPLETCSHPPSVARLLSCASAGATIAREWKVVGFDDSLAGPIGRLVAAVERAFAALTGDTGDLSSEQISRAEHERYIAALDRRWSTLRPIIAQEMIGKMPLTTHFL